MYTKKRLLQHRHPSDVHYGVADYFRDPWPSVVKTGQHAGLAECLDCGAPMMRLVYQESEIYTCLCMHCGGAHRYMLPAGKRPLILTIALNPRRIGSCNTCWGLTTAPCLSQPLLWRAGVK